MRGRINDPALLATFRGEAEEHLGTLGAGLLRLEREPASIELIDQLLRAAHTLKGAARMMGQVEIQDLAHGLEEIFSGVKHGTTALEEGQVNEALRFLDGIPPLLDTATGLAEGGTPPTVAVPPAAPGSAPVSGRIEDSVRVSLERVDGLLDLANELAVGTGQAAARFRLLRRLPQVVTRVHADVAAVASLSPEATPETRSRLQQCQRDLDEIRSGLATLSDQAASEHVRFAPLVDELRFRMKQLRMLPCATMFGGLDRVVRDAAHVQGKTVELELQGEAIELDRKLLDAVRPCLQHLVRNAVAHGVEAPEDRRAAGKPAMATVRVAASQAADRVRIEIADDGRGIDVDAVRRAALAREIVTDSELAHMDEGELRALVFRPGLTTSATVTDLAGRGVGLDVVQREVTQASGTIHLESTSAGTRFIVELPLSVALPPLLVVEASGQAFALPLAAVQELLPLARVDLFSVEGRVAFRWRDRTTPALALADLVGASAVPTGHESPPEILVVLATAQYRVGLFVDRVVGQERAPLRSLESLVGKLDHVGGAAILGSGAVVAVLDPADLVAAGRAHRASASASGDGLRRPPAPRRILIVEDSLTTRELERNILEAQGYQVETAIDGLDALERIKRGHFDLVVSDVEMPRMDGFELCRSLRARPESRALPFVFVTSVERDADRRRGIELGAQAYVVKRAFDQDQLVETIEQLIG